jgi:hypothetical protein
MIQAVGTNSANWVEHRLPLERGSKKSFRKVGHVILHFHPARLGMADFPELKLSLSFKSHEQDVCAEQQLLFNMFGHELC